MASEENEFLSMLEESQPLTENVYLRFNTVMTKTCSVSDFTISNQSPYVPSWLNVDYKNAQWCGKYGWLESILPMQIPNK